MYLEHQIYRRRSEFIAPKLKKPFTISKWLFEIKICLIYLISTNSKSKTKS